MPRFFYSGLRVPLSLFVKGHSYKCSCPMYWGALLEREQRRVRACSPRRSSHVLLSLTCNAGSCKLLLAACRQHIGRKSRLHENEIYECEFKFVLSTRQESSRRLHSEVCHPYIALLHS